ncbi:S-adenosylmethionine:tRNA ribosyltransferase-isomerase [Hydrogenibacillus schlegelii]
MRFLRFRYRGTFEAVLQALGEMPLPPYIRERLDDPERYQTVFAREPGSVAAPTAGLHFTPELIDRLRAAGIETVFVTLHVGLGTFRPVTAASVEAHRMHSEFFRVSPEAAEALNRFRNEGRRIIAVGTTAVRALESAADEGGRLRAREGWTDLFIVPGYRFRAVDGLITNFHLPRSTLLMLVAAFAGRAFILEAYQEAIRKRYRFYSFGDAMLIL